MEFSPLERPREKEAFVILLSIIFWIQRRIKFHRKQTREGFPLHSAGTFILFRGVARAVNTYKYIRAVY